MDHLARWRAHLVGVLLPLVLAACSANSGGTSATIATSSAPALTTLTTAPPTTAAPATTAPAPTTTAAAPTTVAVTDPPPTTSSVPAEPPAPAAPTLTLLDPGAEPRTALRLRYTPGTTTMVMTQTQEFEQTFDGTTFPSAGAFTTVVEMELSAEPAGDSFEVTSVATVARAGDDVDPALATELNAALSAMVGATSSSTIDSRGFVVASKLDEESISGLPPAIAETMSSLAGAAGQAATPFPEEPVGVGARWRLDQVIVSGGIALEQTIEFTVVSIEGDVVTLTGIGMQTADPGSVELPGVPPSADVSIVSWEGTIISTLVIDLTNPVGTGTVETDARQVMSIDEGVQSGELEQNITMSMTFALK